MALMLHKYQMRRKKELNYGLIYLAHANWSYLIKEKLQQQKINKSGNIGTN